jgi:RHS repeat-associated protein
MAIITHTTSFTSPVANPLILCYRVKGCKAFFQNEEELTVIKSDHVSDLNELYNIDTSYFTYDANGNLLTNGSKTYIYDDENRLTTVALLPAQLGGGGGGYVPLGPPPGTGGWKTDFTYDGLSRLRVRQDYYSTTNGGWYLTNTTRYLYDSNRPIQERNAANTPTVSYTRGPDLSSTLEGAGGIGGLLARSHGYSGGNWSTHNYYHADGNGNITYLANSSQGLAASYKYDPYGRTVTSSGSLAGANLYRFSSKEFHLNSGLYYYLYRFYHPTLQRWINRDPLAEVGFKLTQDRHGLRLMSGANLYRFVGNKPADANAIDPSGLTIWLCTRPSEGGGVSGIFQHVYLFDDGNGSSCGQSGSSSGASGAGQPGTPPLDLGPGYPGQNCYMLTETLYDTQLGQDIMDYCRNHANDHIWLPPLWDCHNTIDDILNHFPVIIPPHSRFPTFFK